MRQQSLEVTPSPSPGWKGKNTWWELGEKGPDSDSPQLPAEGESWNGRIFPRCQSVNWPAAIVSFQPIGEKYKVNGVNVSSLLIRVHVVI